MRSFFEKTDDKLKSSSVYQKIFLFLSVLSVAGIVIFQFTSANWDFNSDTATANLLAEAMVREGTLFPKSWVYGQDLWVFFLHLPIALMTLVSDNYLGMRAISAVIFIAMALASCLYFSRKVLKSNAWIIAVPLLFCGFSKEFCYTVFGQCAYIPQIIFLFLSVALFTESFDESFKIKSKLKFALLFAFIMFSALSGLRNVQSIGLPLAGAIVGVYFLENHGERLGGSLKKTVNVIVKAALILLPSALGLLLFLAAILSLSYSPGVVGGLSIISTFDNILKDINEIIASFLLIFNVNRGAPLFSFRGILSIIGIAAFVMIIIVFPILQFKKYKKETFELKFFMVFTAVHTLEIVILYLFTSFETADRYLLTVVMLFMFLSAHYVYKYVLTKENLLRTLAVALMLIMFTLPQTLIHFKNLPKHSENMASQTEITNFLQNEGLTYGFATYWNAYRYTVLSNGKVEINGININQKLDAYYWLNDTKRYSEDVHSGETFLMFTANEAEAFEKCDSFAALGEPSRVLESCGYKIYVYPYNAAKGNFAGILQENK